MPTADAGEQRSSTPSGARLRLKAALIIFAIGSLVATVMAMIELYTMPTMSIYVSATPKIFQNIRLSLADFMLLEVYALVAAVWAALTFGKTVLRQGRGVSPSLVVGFACVALSLMTVSAINATRWVCLTYCNDPYSDFSGRFWHQINPLILVSFVLLLTPQLAGALGGYVIWRTTRARDG